MQISKIWVRSVTGVLETKAPLWEERLVMPTDIYPEFRNQPRNYPVSEQVDDFHYRVNANFLYIESTSGDTGISGPLDDLTSYIIVKAIAPLIINKNALATEYIWDIMHRSLVHGRQGITMFGISAVDCALWDLKGKYLGVPVYILLGGATRDKVPAYASMLGYNVEDMGLVKERALEAKKDGFKAQKWFFRHGPMSGHEGLCLNIEMVKTLRKTLGDSYDIMLDCWQSMNLTYATTLANAISEYNPRWLEEAALPDRIDTYQQLRKRTNIPIAGGEHEYTRWGLRRFIEAQALDILQPDTYWCGGLSELIKIATLGTTYDLITIPHGHSTPANIQFSLSQSPIHTPYQEYLVKHNRLHQFFLKYPIHPIDGFINVPSAIGMSMDLDEDKIESSKEFTP